MGALGGKEGAALIAAMIGSSLVGGITAPQGQKLKSYEGQGGMDPRQLMGESKGLLDDYLGALISNANQPVNLKTTVNPLPMFKGGPLPMAIAAPGADPARANHTLLSTPGLGIPKRTLSAPSADGSLRPGGNTDDPKNWIPPDPQGPHDPANGPPPRTAYDPRPVPGPGGGYYGPPVNGLMEGSAASGDSGDPTQAAVELLMSLGQQSGVDQAVSSPLGRRRLVA